MMVMSVPPVMAAFTIKKDPVAAIATTNPEIQGPLEL
jgi:hypothetical protein